MKHKFLSPLIGAALVLAPLPVLADNSPGPLAPGKAAGVKQAQGGFCEGADASRCTWTLVAGTGLALGLIFWVLVRDNGDGTLTSGPVATAASATGGPAPNN